MKVEVIADLIGRAREDEQLRKDILSGEFGAELSQEERAAVKQIVLSIEEGEVVPAHLKRVDTAAIWFTAS